MTNAAMIWAGVITGLGLGVLGGIPGTYLSIRSTHGPRERAFVVRGAALVWAAVGGFLLALWLTPFPYRAILWLPYAITLPLAAREWNRRQGKIRSEESGQAGTRGAAV